MSERAVELGSVEVNAAVETAKSRPAGNGDLSSSAYDQLLQDYERLQEQSRHRTQALATAAHELKTPLAIMTGYVELLLSDKLGSLSERQCRILHDMRANGVRLQQFINDFLVYSALETGNLNMRLEMADLNACLSELVSFWLHRFHEHGVALYFVSNDKLQPFPFDNYKVQHIVSNLLDNALKYTPSGGTVWLSAEPHLWERRSGQSRDFSRDRRKQTGSVPNTVRVTVSDTGPGIPPELQQEIFEDFYCVSQPGHKPNGMGLGLGIARRLVQAHGGKIWMESQPGQGAKFCFLLPLNPLA